MLSKLQVILAFRRYHTLLFLESRSHVLRAELLRAIALVQGWPEDYRTLIEGKKTRVVFAGFGPKLCRAFDDLMQTGKIPRAEALQKLYPEFYCFLCEVPRLGPKLARRLYYERLIESMDDLRLAIANDALLQVLALGPRRQQILEAVVRLTPVPLDYPPLDWGELGVLLSEVAKGESAGGEEECFEERPFEDYLFKEADAEDSAGQDAGDALGSLLSLFDGDGLSAAEEGAKTVLDLPAAKEQAAKLVRREGQLGESLPLRRSLFDVMEAEEGEPAREEGGKALARAARAALPRGEVLACPHCRRGLSLEQPSQNAYKNLLCGHCHCELPLEGGILRFDRALKAQASLLTFMSRAAKQVKQNLQSWHLDQKVCARYLEALKGYVGQAKLRLAVFGAVSTSLVPELQRLLGKAEPELFVLSSSLWALRALASSSKNLTLCCSEAAPQALCPRALDAIILDPLEHPEPELELIQAALSALVPVGRLYWSCKYEGLSSLPQEAEVKIFDRLGERVFCEMAKR